MMVLGFNNSIYPLDHYQIRILPEWNICMFFLLGSAYYIFRDRIKYNFSILTILLVLALACSYFNLYLGACIILPYAMFYFAFSNKIKLHNTAKYGDFSYGIYIYSFPIQQSIIALAGNGIEPLRLFIYTFPVILILAYLSWHLVEKYAIDLKSKRRAGKS